MGIIVDLAARTVHGFGFPGFFGHFDFPVKIIGMNEVTIAFGSEPLRSSIDLAVHKSRMLTRPIFSLDCRSRSRSLQPYTGS
jgi:hypothetical protein